MSHWIHHMIFDPVSQWERFQFELFCSIILIAFLGLLLGIAALVSKVTHRD